MEGLREVFLSDSPTTIALIVLSYNHPEITAKALRSSLLFFHSQSILVVHNGSLPKNYQQIQNEFPFLQHLILEDNRGYSGGANAGIQWMIEKTSFAWFFFLTNDCEIISFDIKTENLKPCLLAPLIFFRSGKKVDSYGGSIH